MKIYKPKEFAKLCGVCVKTLQRWDNAGTLVARRNPMNRRFYTDVELEMVIGKPHLRVEDK